MREGEGEGEEGRGKGRGGLPVLPCTSVRARVGTHARAYISYTGRYGAYT